MLRFAAPLLGEHTRTILRTELAYSDDKIDELMKTKIIQ